jgi:hypothetical protein
MGRCDVDDMRTLYIWSVDKLTHKFLSIARACQSAVAHRDGVGNKKGI